MKKFRITGRSLFVTGSMEMKQPCSSNVLAEKRSKTPPFSFTIHFRARPTPSDACTTPFCVENLPLKTRTSLPENEITFNRKSNVSALHSINLQIFISRKSILALYKRTPTGRLKLRFLPTRRRVIDLYFVHIQCIYCTCTFVVLGSIN